MIWEIDDRAPVIEGLDAHGRPDPAYAASLGLLPAPRGRRVLAALLEWFLAGLIMIPAFIVLVPLLTQIAAGAFDAEKFFARDDLVWIIVAVAVSQGLMTVFIIVQLVLHGRKGVTLGKAICGIRSVNVKTLERPRFWRGAVVRYLVAYVSLVIPLVGPLLVVVLSPLFDIERRGRGWLDLAAGTWFVDVRKGLNPYDQKRMRIARKRVKTPEHQEKAPLPSLATPMARDAVAEYVPSARLSGGVIGAHRSTPSAAPADGAAVESMVSAVPPSLATGAQAPSYAPPAAAPAPTPAPAAAPAQPAPAPEAMPAPAPAASPVAAEPAASGSDPAAAGVRAVLVLDNGERIEVRGTTIFGRSPSAAAGEGEAHLVRVHDDTRSVSKTHIAVIPARRGVFVVDRASTNGSAVVRQGSETALVAGHPAEVQLGDTVRFGDRTLQVEWV